MVWNKRWRIHSYLFNTQFFWALGLRFSPPSHWGGVNEIQAYLLIFILFSTSICLKKLEAAIFREETSENQLSITHPFGVSGVVTKQDSMSGDGEGNPRQHAWSAPTEHNLPSLVITWPLHCCSDSSPTHQKFFQPGFLGTVLTSVGACRFHRSSLTRHLHSSRRYNSGQLQLIFNRVWIQSCLLSLW